MGKEPNHTTARKPGPLLIIQYFLAGMLKGPFGLVSARVSQSACLNELEFLSSRKGTDKKKFRKLSHHRFCVGEFVWGGLKNTLFNTALSAAPHYVVEPKSVATLALEVSRSLKRALTSSVNYKEHLHDIAILQILNLKMASAESCAAN